MDSHNAEVTALLRRLERHVPFQPNRIALGLVRLSRVHVVQASWVDSPAEIEQAIRAGRAEEGRADRLHDLITTALNPLIARGPRADAEAHAVVMARCRAGRVVWLPSDLAWLAALRTAAELNEIGIAECYLITEYGWRTRFRPLAGSRPALPA